MIKLDTGVLPLRPKVKDTGEYLFEDGSTLYFTLRKLNDQSVILEKQVTEFNDGWGVITIESSDTADIEPGTYIYDQVLIRPDGTRDTLLPEGRQSLYFVIKEGVKQGN